MKIIQKKYSPKNGWEVLRADDISPADCHFVMAFGSKDLLDNPSLYGTIRDAYPAAQILLNSTAGEIMDGHVYDESISLTGIQFDTTTIKTAVEQIETAKDSFEAGQSLARQFDSEGLVSVLIIADGQKINGSELILGVQKIFPKEIIITGGLAGDGTRFQETLVGLNEIPKQGRIAAIGFYGKNIHVSYGSEGGWDSFGPERLITRSAGNILYEFDGKPALDIYKMYLGDFARDLPGTGLLFPLSIRSSGSDHFLVRTILSVNEEEKSLTFAGNVPEGTYARLMTANFDRLIGGASNAALMSMNGKIENPDLAILISCVGRKMVLDQRIEEEVEVVQNIYGNNTAITGFYSYGEFSPTLSLLKSELHNQTITITTLKEA